MLAFKKIKQKDITEKEFDTYFFVSIICSIVGARAYHVLANWEYYRNHLVEIIAIWNGGIGIYGGIIAGTAVLYLSTKLNKRSFFQVSDLFAVVLPLGQAIGRWGNYFNQEIFGHPTTLPWALQVDETNRPNQYKQYTSFHPTFLYESVLNLLNFLILYFLFKKKNLRTGILTAIYCLNYGIIRFVVDIFKIDPDPKSRIGIFTLSQSVSILFIAFGIALFIHISRNSPKAPEIK